MSAVMARRALFVVAFALTAHTASAREIIQLVSDAEYAQEKQFAAKMPRTRQLLPQVTVVPGAPLIDLKKPQIQDTLKAPFPIQLVFKPTDDAEVVPDSFKVLYGFLKLDITDRVVQNAKVTKEGLFVDQANIPAGTHKLLLQIRDSKNRKAEVVVSFNVE
ncbi:MAG: hypothetical protein HYS18_16845 [Burkholderiales bacterium]|nr:hypothetical protein [Burkholderiales bacterium]